jgi:N-acetylglucosamine kinase-like BadF-type ATPase
MFGDAGSGFWIGVAAIKAAAGSLQSGESSGLVSLVLAALDLPATADVDSLVGRAYAAPRTALAALAPSVIELAATGEPTSARIIRLAAAHLLRTLAACEPGGEPIVLSGGVLAAGSPVAERLAAAIERRWGESPGFAGPAERAAAWLAACRISETATARHAAFMSSQG